MLLTAENRPNWERLVPAYFVYICQEVTNRKSLETYWEKIGPTLEGYEAKNIAAYTRFEQLEGEKIEGVAVIEFPTFDRAKTWYESPAYRAIRHFRMDGAKYIGVIAEGGALPPDQRMPQTKNADVASGHVPK
jgi:uncharacterized protein (DUF1330 family)